jgi:hypothetical protein
MISHDNISAFNFGCQDITMMLYVNLSKHLSNLYNKILAEVVAVYVLLICGQ